MPSTLRIGFSIVTSTANLRRRPRSRQARRRRIGEIMLSAEENELLCRVEADAPMGRLMRRHWIPACMSEEVAEPDGKPVRVRLLGEDHVALRYSRGGLGVPDGHCPHKRRRP